MFSEEEANALITAEQIIQKNKDKSLTQAYSQAIEKIRAVLQHTQKDKAALLSERLHIREYSQDGKTSNYLIQLQSAVTNYQVVQLHYHSLAKQKTERAVEPFALIQTQGNWILIAFCRLRKDFRAFRLDCIERLFVSFQTFEPHELTLKDFYERYRYK